MSVFSHILSVVEATFLELNLFINNGIVSTKIYDKRDDFDLVQLIPSSLMTMSLGAPRMMLFSTYSLSLFCSFQTCVYRFTKGSVKFIHYMRLTVCLVFNPIMVESYIVLFICTVLLASDSYAST